MKSSFSYAFFFYKFAEHRGTTRWVARIPLGVVQPVPSEVVFSPSYTVQNGHVTKDTLPTFLPCPSTETHLLYLWWSQGACCGLPSDGSFDNSQLLKRGSFSKYVANFPTMSRMALLQKLRFRTILKTTRDPLVLTPVESSKLSWPKLDDQP